MNFKILSEDELTCRFLARFTGLVGAIDELMTLLKMLLKMIYKAAYRWLYRCYEDSSQGGRHLSHKPCFAKWRYLLGKVNAPQSLLYFNFYDIQASVLWRELAYLFGTNTRWNRENWQPFRRGYDQHPSIPPPWNLTGYIHKRHLYWNISLSAYHKTFINLVIIVSEL